MFKILCENSEIFSFLQNFSQAHWKNALEAACLYGIRQMQSENLTFSIQTIENILHPAKGLKKTLSFIKSELKNLNSAIKRIERRAQSTDLHKDLNFTSFERPKMPEFEIKPRNSDCGKGLKVKTSDLTRIRGIFSKKNEVREPRICNLNDAQKIIQNVNKAKLEVDMSQELFKSRASHSTQDNSPKESVKRQATANFTFGM